MAKTYDDALQSIIKDIKDDDVIVSSTGYISRELYALKDRPRNFYMQGSMGMALAIGLGIAYQRKDLNVIVISGDGACLMSLGTLVLHAQLEEEKNLQNLTHWIIDNNCHGSTGGQKTASDYMLLPSDHTHVIKMPYVKSTAPRISILPDSITERFKAAIQRKG